MDNFGSFATASVQIRADFEKYRADMHVAEQKTQQSTDKMSEAFAGVGRSLLAAGGAVLAVDSLVKGLRAIADAGENMRLLQDRFRAITGSADRAAEAIGLIRDAALATGDQTDLVGGLVTRFTLAAESIGASDKEVVRFTESLIKLGRIGGASSEEIGNATVQLSQALAGGVVRAEEFNSVIENTPFIAKALADSLGVSLGQLRQMVLDGELLSGKVFGGILSMTEKIDRQFSEMEATREQAWNRFGIAAAGVLVQLDKNLEVSRTWVSVLNKAAEIAESIGDSLKEAGARVDKLNTRVAVKRMGEVEAELASNRSNLRNYLARYKADPSSIDKSNIISVQTNIQALLGEQMGLRQQLGMDGGVSSRQPMTPQPERSPEDPLDAFGGYGDFKYGDGSTFTPDEPKKTRAGSGRKADEVAKATEQLIRMNQALQDQEGALGLTGAELARYRAKIEANNAISAAMSTATGEQSAVLKDLATTYVEFSVRLEEATAAQERQEKATEEAKKAHEEAKRAMSDTISTMVRGVQSADNFADAMKNVALSLVEVALKGALLGEGPAKGLSGIFTSAAAGIAGSIFGGGGVAGTQFSSTQLAGQYAAYGAGKLAGGGPAAAGMPYLVNEHTARSETFVPSASGAVLSVAQAQRALSAAAQGSGMSNGGDAAFAPQFSFQINQAVPGVQDMISSAIRKTLSGPEFKTAFERYRGRRGVS